jgi:sigma-B regulation protein RsbU (phosphoserine phosphatase)
VNETVERTNKLLTRNIRRGSFVTLFYGVLDAISGRFTFANAGHNKPYVRRADGTLEMLMLGGLVLGFIGTQKYGQDSVVLNPGDTLFVFSDGVTEAMNAQHDQFEEERLEELLKSIGDVSADEYVQTVHTAVKEHAGSHPQNDDITMLVVKRSN